MPKSAPPYSKLALIWDRMQQDRHSQAMVAYTHEILRRFRVQPQNGLDLCCGTGTAIELLADAGFAMSGLDQSGPMLAMAAKKLKGRGIKLYQKSLPKFRLLDGKNSQKTRCFDLVTCFYDSLNYLTTVADLRLTFRSVYAHLQPAGWFIFDMNTPEALKTLWDQQVYGDAWDDLAWVWKNEYDPKRKLAACHATCFYKQGQSWQRFDETHWERGYENDQIKRCLKGAGFNIRGFWKCRTFRKPGPRAYRIAVAAQRPG